MPKLWDPYWVPMWWIKTMCPGWHWWNWLSRYCFLALKRNIVCHCISIFHWNIHENAKSLLQNSLHQRLVSTIFVLSVKGPNPNRTTTLTTTTTTSTTTPTTTAPKAKGMYKLMIFEILLLWKKNLNVLYMWSKA